MTPTSARIYRPAALLLSAVFLLFAASPSHAATRILVPAYFYPESGGDWDRMTNSVKEVPITAILNPDSGPGSRIDSNYMSALSEFRSAGGRVIGYVSTAYATRPLEETKKEVDRYQEFYDVDGIFFDEMTNDAGVDHYVFYKELYDYVKSNNPDWIVIGNPGTATEEAYLTLPTADVLVVADHFTDLDPLDWYLNHKNNHFGALLYKVQSSGRMQELVQSLADSNVGYLYVTDGTEPNPWNHLPSYWEMEVQEVIAINSPTRDMTISFWSGLFALVTAAVCILLILRIYLRRQRFGSGK